MPIYDYRCEACGHTFEDLRGINDPDPDACPSCGAPQVKKMITGGNFQLKGGGWYVTDYAGKKSGKSNSPAGSAATDSGSGEGKPDSTSTSDSGSSSVESTD